MKTTEKNIPADAFLPLGFGVALAQNDKALEKFSRMSQKQRDMFLFEARHMGIAPDYGKLTSRIASFEC